MVTARSQTGAGARARSRRGRNPSIDVGKIEQAVREVGNSGDVSMKEVAAHLGVNVTTLYRHMGGIEGLHRIRARQLAAELPPPPSTEGHSWQSWLEALAHYYRSALLQHPDLLEYAHAALDPDFEKLEQAATALVGFGFSPRAAAMAHAFMINNVVGFVHTEMRTIDDARQGHSSFTARMVDQFEQTPERLPTLRSLKLDEKTFNRDLNFDSYIKYMVAGIKAQRGVPK